jgi:hypothetical protein
LMNHLAFKCVEKNSGWIGVWCEWFTVKETNRLFCAL